MKSYRLVSAQIQRCEASRENSPPFEKRDLDRNCPPLALSFDEIDVISRSRCSHRLTATGSEPVRRNQATIERGGIPPDLLADSSSILLVHRWTRFVGVFRSRENEKLMRCNRISLLSISGLVFRFRRGNLWFVRREGKLIRPNSGPSSQFFFSLYSICEFLNSTISLRSTLRIHLTEPPVDSLHHCISDDDVIGESTFCRCVWIRIVAVYLLGTRSSHPGASPLHYRSRCSLVGMKCPERTLMSSFRQWQHFSLDQALNPSR